MLTDLRRPEGDGEGLRRGLCRGTAPATYKYVTAAKWDGDGNILKYGVAVYFASQSHRGSSQQYLGLVDTPEKGLRVIAKFLLEEEAKLRDGEGDGEDDGEDDAGDAGAAQLRKRGGGSEAGPSHTRRRHS